MKRMRAQAWRSRFAAPVTAAAAEWSPRADGLPDTTATPPRRARTVPAPQAAPYARTPTQLRPGHKGPAFAARMSANPCYKHQPAAPDSESDGSGAPLPHGIAAGYGSGFDGGARHVPMPAREAKAAGPPPAAVVSAGLEGGEVSDASAAAAGDGAVAPRGDADDALDVSESDIEDDGARRWAAAQRHARLVRSPRLN